MHSWPHESWTPGFRRAYLKLPKYPRPHMLGKSVYLNQNKPFTCQNEPFQITNSSLIKW